MSWQILMRFLIIATQATQCSIAFPVGKKVRILVECTKDVAEGQCDEGLDQNFAPAHGLLKKGVGRISVLGHEADNNC